MSVLVLLDSKSRITICPPLTDKPTAASPEAPLSKDIEHILQGRARLIAQYVGKPRLDDLLCIYIDQIQLLEDALWDLATLRTIDAGEGVQLDGIGDIVRQERQGFSDDDYRPLLRARVRANKSEGTAPDIIAVAVAAMNEPPLGQIEFESLPPAGFELLITDQLIFPEEILNDLIQDATLAGVRANVIVTLTAAEINRFDFADGVGDDNVFDADSGFDSATTPGTGNGEFSRALGPSTG
jgi:hypothetical protein